MTLSTPKLSIIQPKPLPKGTADYERRRNNLLESFASKVPSELRLPAQFFLNPPIDVSKVPASCGILTPEELDITENYDAVGLVQAIAIRKLTALDVVTAFCKRAIIAHQLTCCLTQWFMPEALNQAKELDASQENWKDKRTPPWATDKHKRTYTSCWHLLILRIACKYAV